MRRLDVEPGADERADHVPLVQPEAVHHDQQRLAVRVAAPARTNSGTMSTESGGRSASEPSQPAGVVPLEELARNPARRLILQRPERVLQAGLVGVAQPDLPLRQLHDQLDPLAPGQRRAPAGLELAEPGGEVAREPLLPDPVALEQPGDHREDLARIDRLDQVVGDLGADGVLERGRLLALGHHDHRHRVVDRADGLEQLQPPAARHLLVEQHDAVGLALQQHQRVVAVGGLLDA